LARHTQIHRLLDLWIGVPAICMLRLVRRRRRLPSSPARIGFIAPTAIGDLILDTGMMIHVARRYPHAELHLFHGSTNAGVIPLLPVEVISHQCNFTEFGNTLRQIRDAALDVTVDLTPWPRLTALYAVLSGARAVGFQSSGQLRHYAFDVAVEHTRNRHEVDNLREMASVFGECARYEVRIRMPPEPPRTAIPWERTVLCHVSPGGSRAGWKRWPTENWIAVVKDLVKSDLLVGFTGTEGDARWVDEILARADFHKDRVMSLCGKLSLVQLAAALTRCRLFITVDTGVLHLASALDVPTIALMGPTRSARWGARSSRAINIDSPHPGSGFIHLGFEGSRSGSEIMSSLSVATVIEAARRLLA
jgi:ADP-heptose:LPS heptosyltransferase